MIDYPFVTSVCGPSEIESSTKTQAQVEDYYKSYGRAAFIWFKTWEEAYEYCMKENKRLTIDAKKHLDSLKDDAKNFKIEKKIRQLEAMKAK